jgi:death on curing protein
MAALLVFVIREVWSRRSLPRKTRGSYRGGDLFDIAATYAFHIAESQAFFDGNKRTAITTALTFLELNGAYAPPDQDALYDAMIAISACRLDKAGLADVLRRQFPQA